MDVCPVLTLFDSYEYAWELRGPAGPAHLSKVTLGDLHVFERLVSVRELKLDAVFQFASRAR